jgi:hypothetical protein
MSIFVGENRPWTARTFIYTGTFKVSKACGDCNFSCGTGWSLAASAGSRRFTAFHNITRTSESVFRKAAVRHAKMLLAL